MFSIGPRRSRENNETLAAKKKPPAARRGGLFAKEVDLIRVDPILRPRSSQALKPDGVTRSASPPPAERADGAESGPEFPSGFGAEPNKGRLTPAAALTFREGMRKDHPFRKGSGCEFHRSRGLSSRSLSIRLGLLSPHLTRRSWGREGYALLLRAPTSSVLTRI